MKKTVHRVQLLDPATGTGTFIAEALRQVHAKFVGNEGMWPGYVENDLLPRLNAALSPPPAPPAIRSLRVVRAAT